MSQSALDLVGSQARWKSSLLSAILWMMVLWMALAGFQLLGSETSQTLVKGGAFAAASLGLIASAAWLMRGWKQARSPHAELFASGFLLVLAALAGKLFLNDSSSRAIGLVFAAGLGLAPWMFFLAGIDLFQRLRLTDQGNPLLDGALAAAGFSLPCWHLVLSQAWFAPGAWSIERAMLSVQPVGYTACVFSAVATMSLLNRRGKVRRGPAFAVLGLIFFALGGTLEAHHLVSFLDSPGRELGFQWIIISIGLCFFLASAVEGVLGDSRDWQIESDLESSSEPLGLSIARVSIPNILSLGAFVFTSLYEVQLKGSVPPVVVLVGTLLMLIAMSRQAYVLLKGQTMLRDNELLTEKLRQVTGGLEETIAQRTRQLNAIHQLTKAVSNTLDPTEVLSMAAVHGRTALRADAVVIWLAEGEKHEEIVMKGALQLGLADRPELSQQLYIVPSVNSVQCLPVPLEPDSPSGAIAALLQAPMIWQQQLVGIIGVMRFRGAFNKTEWEMVEAIGLETGTALKHAQQYSQAKAAADRDPLTGLLNHRAIHQFLDESLEKGILTQQPVAVMMMDMNNFKMFNDTYGHPAGDEALRRVSKALAEACQGGGAVGRYGGDEFLAVLPGFTQNQVVELVQHVKSKLVQQGFVPNPADGRVIPIALSYGIASFPKDSQSRHELITFADANLYSAKMSEGGIKATSDIQRQSSQLRNENSFAVLDGMVTAVDNKDSYTRRHSEDVAEYSLWIADELGLSPETQRTIRVGALLHDLGKITVPDEILRKPGRLTPEEFEILKRHPRLGALIVSGVPGMEFILDIVQHHHERWDGKGYPDELKGEEIPFLGRLVAVADTFSAMTTDRPYRKGLSWEIALKEIADNSGSQFDPALADAFLRAASKRRERSEAA